MPAELTDVESVRQFMQKSPANKLQDEDLEILILQSSGAIERYCNRQFVREEASTKSFEFLVNNTGLDLIDLKPYEYRKLNTVTIDPDLTPVVLGVVQYRPWKYPAIDGTFFGLHLANTPEPVLPSTISSPLLPYHTRRIDVNADWGMAAIPGEVQHWANATVKGWAEEGLASPSPEGFVPVPRDLPEHVRQGLDRRWVRPTPEA